jgi:hypothetical protein
MQIVLETPSPKYQSINGARGVVQVVECLLCKPEVQSSNPSPPPALKNQKNRNLKILNIP